MSYQVLARKWRPRTLQDMVGQEHIVQMLTNALEQQRLHHAYLFTGTRGVGKTTLARILTKCLNCETGITSTPCGTCNTCMAIDAGHFIDLHEVDAASRTKVEETRELLENVQYMPTQGRYKVYLIDEVHMLSQHSFNALLKTLEEPPEHVKFILATTDPKRLPATILSRCLQFHLKRIVPEYISKHLCHVCDKEEITYAKEGLDQLARDAEGSMRDALSLLDQAIAYGNGNITKDQVHAMMGHMSQKDLYPLLNALALKDGKQLFKHIAELAEYAPDFQYLLAELISLFHQMAIIQVLPDAIVVDEMVVKLSQAFSPEEVQLYYQIALLGRRDLSFAPSTQQGFEMTLLRMLAFKPVDTTGHPRESGDPALDKTSRDNTVIPEKVGISQATQIPALSSVNENLQAITTDTTTWRQLLGTLSLSGMAYALAANCTLVSMTHHKVTLALFENHKPMLNQKLQDRIAQALTQHFNRPIQLEIIITQEAVLTPMQQTEHEQQERLETATQSILQDPRVKKLVEMYDATIEVSLLN